MKSDMVNVNEKIEKLERIVDRPISAILTSQLPLTAQYHRR